MDLNSLNKKYGPAPNVLTNGTVIQFCKDAAKLPVSTSAIWLLTWIGDTSTPQAALRSKMQRVAQKASKLRGDNLTKFKDDQFTLPGYTHQNNPSSPSLQIPDPSSRSSPPQSPSPATPITRPKLITTPIKKFNSAQHGLRQKERQICLLEKKVRKLKNEASERAKKNMHYSVKNVRRREERNLEMRNKLRFKKFL